MNPNRLDLNLLRVFVAVLEERNLLRAGKRLNLSQSAVSHALSRLREALEDDLFVRTGAGMEPTARALVMAEPIRDALQRITDTVSAMHFEPAQAMRQFILAANDYVTTLLLPPLGRQFERDAPGVDLVVRPSTRIDLAEKLDAGRIDLVVGHFAQVPARYQSMPVCSYEEVFVMRKGHPIGRRRLHLQDLARYPLVTVSVGGPEEGAVGGFILERGLARQSEMFNRHALEDAVIRAGVTPRLRVTTPHAMAIPALLRDSDMLSVVPSLLATVFVASGLVARQAPYVSSPVTLRALWHRRNEHDPAHKWLRDQVAKAGSTL